MGGQLLRTPGQGPIVVATPDGRTGPEDGPTGRGNLAPATVHAMRAELQRRVQRYGWDRASAVYESLWRDQLAPAQEALVDAADLRPGERVLDVACGTGLVTFAAARKVGPHGWVLGTDISGSMVDAARARALEEGVDNVEFVRKDAEDLGLANASFHAVLCALGLMYVPDVELAAREMRRVARPGGRVVVAVWGKRNACGWAPVFPITEAEVKTDVCPLFFHLGEEAMLQRLFASAQLELTELRRITTTLRYSSAEAACDAAFVGGPVALAWSRFDEPTRQRVRATYTREIEPWRNGQGYAIPAQFVVAAARTN
jgi:ubiquinone/menaquinone biosynthesis C-methylase UbiE